MPWRPGARTTTAAVLLLVGLGSATAEAHPHVFVDSHIHFHVDENGHLGRVDVLWRHDEFFSMLLLTEMGLDPVAPPDAEGLAALAALVPDWLEDYGGGGVLEGPQGDLPLGAPVGIAADFTEGRIEMRFSRPLDPPLDVAAAGPITVWLYDPLAFTAYIVEGVTADAPTRCRARFDAFDADALSAEMAEMLAALGREEVVDEPGVGRLLADRVWLRCD